MSDTINPASCETPADLFLTDEELEAAAGGADPITWILDHYKEIRDGIVEGWTSSSATEDCGC